MPYQAKRNGGGYGATGSKGLELLVTCENAVIYQPSFDFYGIIEHSLLKNISIEMDKAIN